MNCDGSIEIMDLQICKEFDLLKRAGKVIIYGAADCGVEVCNRLEEIGMSIDFFCDMNMGKWGKCIEGIEIISPFELRDVASNQDENIYVIACIARPKELVQLLNHMKISSLKVITYWGVITALYLNKEYIYGKFSRRCVLLQLENEKKKSNFCNILMDDVAKLVRSSDNDIWIVQPGKTASSTLELRLRQQGIPFIKEHHLTYSKHVVGPDYEDIWNKVIEERKGRPLKIIVAVREPLARDYSAFWQPFSKGLEHIFQMPILQNDFQEMYNAFINLILSGSRHTQKVLGQYMPSTWNDEFQWFDEEIKEVLKIDVFSYPFDREKGYTIIKQDNIELLLLKVEKLENNMDIISEFVGAESLPMVNANIADEKWYGLAYKQFRRDVKLPAEYIRHYYECNNKMDYFYTAEEKAQFLAKWKENVM